MDFGILGKKALVTGAGRGLGESIAMNLAKEGCQVAITSRTQADLNHLEARMSEYGSGHFKFAIDLAEKGAPQQLVEAVEMHFGVPDIIVHNVGGNLGITDPFCSVDDWRKVWRLNLEVAVEINNAWVPQLQKKKWGRVVHISSIASLENQGAITYCSVKAALSAYARGLGRIVASDGVIVTSVLPGAIFTEKGYWDLTKLNRPEHYNKFLQDRMAIGRFGVPDEIGSVVAFLCSEQASFMVGSMVPVDGGQGRTFFSW